MRTIIIADDLTGACDTAIAMKRKNERACVCFQKTVGHRVPGEPEVLAFHTDSRTASAQNAYDAVYSLVTELQKTPGGGFRFYKKIDSLFRGNVGAEIEAAVRASGCDCVLLAPAAPAHGRIIRGGRLYTEPARPEKGMDLHPLLKWKDAPPFVSVGLREVRQGAAALEEYFQKLRRSGAKRILADGETEEDLRIVAQAAQALGPDIVLAGNSGFAGALRQEIRTGHLPEQIPQKEPPVLFVLGSCSSVTRDQCEHFLTYPRTGAVWLRAEQCLHGERDREVERAYHRCQAFLETGPMALILAVDSLQDGAVECAGAGGNREISSRQIVDALGQVVSRLMECYSFEVLFLSGGDTAQEILKKIGAESMEVFYELLPGMPLAKVRCRSGQELLAITKSGSFGETETFSKIFEIMTGRIMSGEAI